MLSATQLRELDRLAQLIAGSPHALVSRRDRAKVRDVHVEEALAVEPLLGAEGGTRWLDLGTGAGLPGLVLATVRPDVHWTLVDATAKKVEAVRAFALDLDLRNVRAVAGRAETLAHQPLWRERFAGVVSRGVGPLTVLAELARGFLDQGALLAAVKGPRWPQELEEARFAMRVLGLGDVRATAVPSTVRPTWVVSMRATGPIPADFPRRDGLPRSKPLGRPHA